MALRNDEKFKEERTRGFENVMRKLAYFDQALESIEIFILKGSFCAKYILFELKRYRGVILRDTE